jgi:formylmethanofuran dehydrogenase subunit A
VTIYAPDDDRRRMFALPRWVVKAGEVVVDDGTLAAAPVGRTLFAEVGVDADAGEALSARLGSRASFHPANFALGLDDVANPQGVRTGARP